MKKLNLFAVLFISLLIFSCKKENTTAPVSPAGTTPVDSSSSLPEYNESNSARLTWEQLPEELKNAVPIVNDDNSKMQSPSQTSFSYLSYSVGPWGGGGGGAFSIVPPSGSRIYAIAIRSGSLIDRFTVWYVNASGTIYVGGDKGGSGGTYYPQFFSADEYIYYVAGRSGAYLDHLTVYTNKKSFTYGGTGGSPFSFSVPAGYQILGFYGRSGEYVDRMGFYVYTR